MYADHAKCACSIVTELYNAETRFRQPCDKNNQLATHIAHQAVLQSVA